MRFGSVCSGIEAASVAWNPLGWRAQFLSEIEPFPCDVLAHHYPDVPNRGDMTKFKDWPDATIDVLCGGTPCQSFSVAGLRKGLDDPRGNLMLTFGAVAAKYRPRWLVWENVPGVLSSNSGRDFGAFLGLMSDDDIDSTPEMQIRQVWRPVGTWEGSPRSIPERKPRNPAPLTDAQARVLAAVKATQPATREQVAAALDVPMAPAPLGTTLRSLACKGLCRATGKPTKWVAA